jgi:hypothetical protein
VLRAGSAPRFPVLPGSAGNRAPVDHRPVRRIGILSMGMGSASVQRAKRGAPPVYMLSRVPVAAPPVYNPAAYRQSASAASASIQRAMPGQPLIYVPVPARVAAPPVYRPAASPQPASASSNGVQRAKPGRPLVYVPVPVPAQIAAPPVYRPAATLSPARVAGNGPSVYRPTSGRIGFLPPAAASASPQHATAGALLIHRPYEYTSGAIQCDGIGFKLTHPGSNPPRS